MNQYYMIIKMLEKLKTIEKEVKENNEKINEAMKVRDKNNDLQMEYMNIMRSLSCIGEINENYELCRDNDQLDFLVLENADILHNNYTKYEDEQYDKLCKMMSNGSLKCTLESELQNNNKNKGVTKI